jgi:hypothetical protein
MPLLQAAVSLLATQLPALFVFALVWSVGATTDENGRQKFDVFLRDLLAASSHPAPFPAALTVYDYSFDRKEVKVVRIVFDTSSGWFSRGGAVLSAMVRFVWCRASGSSGWIPCRSSTRALSSRSQTSSCQLRTLCATSSSCPPLSRYVCCELAEAFLLT